MAWQEKAAAEKARIDESIPSEWRLKNSDALAFNLELPTKSGLLTGDELAITESSAVDLVAKLSQGALTSVAVTTAFCKRAALAQQLVNLLILTLYFYMSLIVCSFGLDQLLS